MANRESSDGPFVAYTLALTQSVRSSLVLVRDAAAELAARIGCLLCEPSDGASGNANSGLRPLKKHSRNYATAQRVQREAESLKLTCDAIFPEVEQLLAVVAGEPSLSLSDAALSVDAKDFANCSVLHATGNVEAAGSGGCGARRRSPLVGRGWGGAYGCPGNGYESLLCILWRLLQRLEVETALTNQEAAERRARQRSSRRSPRLVANSGYGLSGGVDERPSQATAPSVNWRELERRWLAPHSSANQLTPLGRLTGHHLQLKQFYAMIHLACRCVRQSDVGRTLFVPMSAEFDHRVWAPVVKLDSFQGVHFGFQYSREMRTVLRIVQVIRSAVRRAVASEYFRRSAFARKLAFFSWGWFYIHMALLENYGYSTSMAQQIVEKLASAFGASLSTVERPAGRREAADTPEVAARSPVVSLDEARMFFNLSEDPLFLGFALIREKDVALDQFFEIDDAADALKRALHKNAQHRVQRSIDHSTSLSRGDAEMSSDADARGTRLKLPAALHGPLKARLLSSVVRCVQIKSQRTTAPSTAEHSASGTATCASAAESFSPAPMTDCWQRPHEMDETSDASADATAAAMSPDRFRQHADDPWRASNLTVSATEPVAATDASPRRAGAAATGPDSESGSSVWAADSAALQRDTADADGALGNAAAAAAASNGIDRSPRALSTTPAEADAGDPPQSSSRAARSLRRERSGSLLASAISSSMRSIGARIDSLLRHQADEGLARSLIVFFHGGGFIGQSSLTHTSLLKQIAHDIPDAVVVSMDYRLAPEYPYPTAVNECFHFYIWALENAHLLGTHAERIVVAGDSAGGNLAVVLTILLIQHGLRLPDGLVLAYPALNLTLQWSPSRLLSAFDPLLSIDLLELILQSYVPADVDASRDPYLSPCIAASDTLLEAFPPVYMVCGAYDPLLDDTVEFAHRLRLVKRDTHCDRDAVRLRVYEGMPHGFLSMSSVIHEASAAVSQVTLWMSELLQVSWAGDHERSCRSAPSSPRLPLPAPSGADASLSTSTDSLQHTERSGVDLQASMDTTKAAAAPATTAAALRQAMRELSVAFSVSESSDSDSDEDRAEQTPLFA